MNTLVKAHKAGLFSLVNNVISCLDMGHDVEVDWSDSMYSPNKEDLFTHLFEPMPKLPRHTLTISNYLDQWLTYKNAAKLYDSPDQRWRERLNAQWSKLRVRSLIAENAEDFVNAHLANDFISVLVRADTHAGEQISDRSQTLDEYAREIEKALQIIPTYNTENSVFLCCGDKQTADWLSKRFPVAMYPDRVPQLLDSRAVDRHETVPQTPRDAEICLEEVLIMSEGSALVHPCSNMATTSLYINPGQKSFFIP